MKELSAEQQETAVLALAINSQAIKKQAIQRMIAMSLYTLVDFNWNLNVTIASDNLTNTKIPTLLLQLILKKPGEVDENRIELEFSKEELEDFLERLQRIQKTVLESDQEEEAVII